MTTFPVAILRPDRVFFEGDAVGVRVASDEIHEEIRAGHMPMLLRFGLGMMELFLPDGTARKFATGDGMLQVKRDSVLILSDFLAWEDHIDTAVAHRQSYITAENERRRRSYHEYRINQINMSKTFISLGGRDDRKHIL